MGDWSKLVRERLNLADLPLAQQDETIAELASHLDDLYAHRERGLDESEATQRAIQEVPDWRSLARHIQRAKQEESMNHRTKQLWLPGLINLTIALCVVDARLLLLDVHMGVQAAMVLYFYFPCCSALCLS
jgi:hypothetical protein